MQYRLGRREFLMGAASAALLSQVRGVSAAEGNLDLLKGDGDIILCSWGGGYEEVMKTAWFEPFLETSGISVSTTGVPDLAKLRVMNQVNNIEWDIIDTEGAQMYRGMQEDLFEKIDYDLLFKIVPKEELIPELLTEYGVGSVSFSTVIIWNTDKIKEGPKNWVEFFDTDRFKGRRALYAQPKPALEIALMAAGVPKDKVYPMNVDEAFAALDKIGDKVDLWVEKTSQWSVLMDNREVDLMGGNLARAYAKKQAGDPFDYHFNESINEQSYWTIPKGAPGAEKAQKLLAYMMRAEGQTAFVSKLPYGVANKTIYDNLSKEMADQLPSSPQNIDLALRINAQWWIENGDAVQPRWLDWISKR